MTPEMQPEPYYRSRVVRIGRPPRFLMWVEGPWQGCQFMLDAGPMGDFCRWNAKYLDDDWWRRVPKLWPLVPAKPRPYELRLVDVGPASEAGGWLLAFYALWRALAR